MTEPHRREGDPPESEDYLRRVVDPALWMVELTRGKWGLRLRGYAAALFTGVLLVVGSNIYTGQEVRASIDKYTKTVSREHRMQATEDQKTRCVLALSIEQRARLLEDRYPGAWTRACWWLSENTNHEAIE